MRVVVLGGRGKAFCGGADVKEISRLDRFDRGRLRSKDHAVCEAIRELPVR
jgi:enoyl-CoA hydratase/carnithine racemase